MAARWIRLNLDYLEHPKILAAGRDGRDLHLASLLWMGRVENDGEIPAYAVDHIAATVGLHDPERRAAALEAVINAGLWVPSGMGYAIKNFTKLNGTKADHERASDMQNQRQQKRRVTQKSRRDMTVTEP